MAESSSTFIIIIQHISISISGGGDWIFSVFLFSSHSFFLVFIIFRFPLLCVGFPLASRNWFVRICRDRPIENRESNIYIMEGCMSIGL
jgi:hypothetical protein